MDNYSRTNRANTQATGDVSLNALPVRSIPGVLVVLVVLLLVFACDAHAQERDVYVIRNDGVAVLFAIEIADTAAARANGLMHRETLPARSGMLFDFGRETAIRMWMKNTLIPLDMVFADDNGTIRHVAANTVPYSESLIHAPEPTRYVLEINGGEAQRLGIGVGDRLLLPARQVSQAGDPVTAAARVRRAPR